MRHVLLLALLPLAGCGDGPSTVVVDDARGGTTIAATGSGGTRSYRVADFTGVALRGDDDVDVRVGSAFTVRAEGDPEVLDYLRVARDGDTLRIERRPRTGFDWSGRTVKVYVTMPRIVAGAVAGSGDLAIDRVEGTRFAASSAGSGSIAIAALAVRDVRFDLAGAGGLSAAGTADRAAVNIAGSGNLAARGLRAAGAEVAIAGSGNVALTVAGPAQVSLLGSGNADLGPQARCTVSRVGTGQVRCGG